MGLFMPRNLFVLAFLATILVPHIRADCDPELEFSCHDGRCISIDLKCNREPDCSSGEDEENCEECFGFICDDGLCIDNDKRCDRTLDCKDGEDEDDCIGVACTTDEFTCKSGSCIPQLAVCDSARDCPDGDDEQNCECARNEFKCLRGGTCIQLEQKCDGTIDCPDESDEYSCQGSDCLANEIQCDSNKCVPDIYKCDGVRDCEDGADETDCPETKECNENEFQCENSECIDLIDRCNGYEECADKSDEKNCTQCGLHTFHCRRSQQCIPDYKQCDNTVDCEDRSDEQNCEEESSSEAPAVTCLENEWTCANGECINKDFLCDKTPDCIDNSDEDDETCYGSSSPSLPVACEHDEFSCGGRCIESERVCDGIPDCVDYSDEYNCTATTAKPICEEDECADGTCIYQYQRCNGVRDCPDGEDETGCPCRDDEFQCDDGSCIPESLKCNRQSDCRDGADERECGCRSGEFQCQTGECISESSRCDRRVDCRDGSDENKCIYTTTRSPTTYPPPTFTFLATTTSRPQRCRHDEWQCGSGECIPLQSHCDSRFDCRDYSDEKSCPPSQPTSPVQLNLKTYPNDQTIKERLIKEGREVVFQCRDEGPIRARVHWIRRNGQPLPIGTRDLNGRLEIPNIQMDHSGEYICEAVGYPKSTQGSSVSVQLNVEKYNRSDSRLIPQACAPNQATCMSGDCIAKSKICDGVADCADGSDEPNSCTLGRCEPNEFKCNNRKCILKTWRCDGENDCGDDSDEEGCQSSTAVGSCRYDEFQCANRQCIPKSFQCDSQSDCADNSDEIGCIAPAVITPPPPMVQLQAGVVFNITCRATGNPIPLIVWRLNWGHIPEKCKTSSENGFGTLSCPDIQPIDSGAYSCEIINSMGTHFVSPDTILIVIGRDDICPSGKFNGQARREDECINCFCFGVSTQCKSADLYSYTLNPPVTSQTIVGINGPWNGLPDVTIAPYDRHGLVSTRHGVQFRVGDVPAGNRNYPYLALPSEYHGNQLKSYGGFLRYEVEFNGRGQSNDIPDIIIQGNGYTLTYRSPGRFYANQRSNVTAQLYANNWYKLDGRYASREEMMMTLANIDNILIKLQYVDGGERSVELLHVNMDSAALRNFGLGSANFVEECRCPAGYTGLSCETCDIGYIRQKTGPWLGRCVREEEPCRPGTYGDPTRGIPCKQCPCPVPGQSHARTCSLERNGEVVCHCDRGYIGRRCEECAPGYTGNPMSPRGCYPAPSLPACNPDGTERIVGGRCECKTSVIGPYCDQCEAGTYYLNPRGGCINCFCMGVTPQCTSSSLYRDKIRASFASNKTGFSLVSGYDDAQIITEQLSVENRELVYKHFEPNEPYYWSLPINFLGNKLTAYGGNLTYTVRYTPQPSGGASVSNSPDVVIISDAKITLHHYRREGQPPSGLQTFVVPVHEEYWQHYADGTSANRQHLLMALANVKAIYIKATYTTVAREASLSQVELDIATPQNFGSQQRAWEVEDCTCPLGHQGLSCEDCSPGFFKGEEGLYLGLCERCQCNGHSDECDSQTGVCINCRDNTEGENCEQCSPGFGGNATYGAGGCVRGESQIQCSDCSNEGTASCDLARRTCNCKPNVDGIRCDQCREGTFGLSEINPYGCSECFCSGTTRSCSTGSYSRDEIPLDFYDEEEIRRKFAITDREGRNSLPNNFEFTFESNEIKSVIDDDSHVYYWNLPDRLRGNMVLAYGGSIKLTQRTDGDGSYFPDQDVIIRGNSITLVYTREDLQEETYKIPLSENGWHTIQRSGPKPATRADFLTVLSNVESILIRASLRTYTTESIISDISLSSAVKNPDGDVDDIEVCRCPPGYKGTSCEQCENLYYRDVFDRSVGLLGACKMCPCENAASCSMGANRRVMCQCLPGWTGEFCRERAGLPTTERPVIPTRPPPTIKVVINTPQIKIVEIGETTQFNCMGYYIVNNVPVNIQWYKSEGRLSQRAYVDQNTLYIQNAQVDDSGVYICQAQIGSEVVRDNVTLTVGDSMSKVPVVTIAPSLVDQDEYSVAEIRCTASGYPAPQIQWTRLDNYLSSDAVSRDGYLRFNSLRKYDEGSYRCLASNDAGEADQVIQIYVRERVQPPTRPPVEDVILTPTEYTGEPGQEIKLHCGSQQRGRVVWTKLGAVELPRNVFVSGDELIIQYPTVDDSGKYLCTIQFVSGITRSASADVTIVARSNEKIPQIKPLEHRYSVSQGTDFELTCEVSGEPYPTVTWTLNGAPFATNTRSTGNVLRILNARPENSGIYVCIATNSAGSDQAATVIEIERREPPVIELFPNEPQKLKVGESTRVSCRATSGTPYPMLSWVRRDGKSLSSRITEDYPGVITLREATLDDTGLYECRATSLAGSTSLNVNIEVQLPPTIVSNENVINLTEGDELIISCVATGIPSPNVEIKPPQGASVRASATGPTRLNHPEARIHHYDVQKSQAGVYECIATSEAGQDLKYIQVNINSKRGDVGHPGDDPNEIDTYPSRTTARPQTRPTQRSPVYPPFPEPDENPIPPNQPVERPPFTVHLGERAELNCNAQGNTMRTEWRRADGRSLPLGTRIYDGQMVIENVRNDAAGAYECVAYDQRTGRPFTLIVGQIIVVAGPPKIQFSPPMPIIVKSGEDVIIFCNASGEQPMRVHWHSEGGQPLPSTVDVRGNYLRFNRIAPADEGRYVCTALNQYGNTTKVAEVIVNHNVPHPEIYGRTKEAFEGDTVSLTCTDDNPRGRYSRYEWEREYESLPPLAENRENILVLYNIRQGDGGRYICRSFADDGTRTENYVDLTIKPRIPYLKLEPSSSRVKPGNSLEVDCTSSVGPQVKVIWEGLDKSQLPFNFEQYGNRLLINNAKVEDSGKYNCVCYTDDGQVYMSEYELIVEEGPSVIREKPSKVEHAEVGTTVVLRCNSQKYPASYSWSRQHGSFAPDVNTSSDILTLIHVQANDAGTYVCTVRHNGDVVEVPTTLVVTGAIPFFPQSPRSYIEFPKLDQAFAKFKFEITFRPERPNGLILYNGQRRGGGDFISLSLNNGIPEFRYSFGDQQAVLSPEKPVSLGEWHTIKVNRVRTNGWMMVDDQHPVIFPPSRRFQELNLEEHLFIGSVPKFEHISPNATEVKEGFVGCISRLVLNERDIQLTQEAIYTEGTTSCEPCADEPCLNDGVCLETQTEHGYTCVCQEGYTGKNCQVEGFKCSLDVCGIGRCGETDTGFECYCPLNRTGDRCQYIEHYDDGILSFRDGSYAAYDKPTRRKSIKFKVRPETDDDGVIVYAAESDRAYGDFIAVIIKDKHIEMRYTVGGKVIPTIIRSKNPVKVGEWMDISAGRSGVGVGYLQVDNEPQINEQKTGRAPTLFLKTNLYVGGYDKRIVLNSAVGVTKGFQGCIAGLEISGRAMDMIADMRDSANVQNCGHRLIHGEDDGSGSSEIVSSSPPSCRPGFTGRSCNIISDICLANEPCENGGICTTLSENKYTCDCTLGFTGTNCQHMVNLETSALFKGNSYLELDRNTIANSTSQLLSGIAVLFSTKQPNGMLLWYGQNKGSAYNGEDFLALTINDGILEFAFRLDGEESLIKHVGARVDTGHRHVAIIKRRENQASLELDGFTQYGETRPTGKKEMILPGHIFLGGAPDLKSFTGDRYNQGFVGCIHIVEPLEGGAIQLGARTISSMNVDACPVNDDDDDDDFLGTEPPVV